MVIISTLMISLHRCLSVHFIDSQEKCLCVCVCVCVRVSAILVSCWGCELTQVTLGEEPICVRLVSSLELDQPQLEWLDPLDSARRVLFQSSISLIYTQKWLSLLV